MALFETTSRAFQATANAVDDAVWIAQALAKEFVGNDALADQLSAWCGDAGHLISSCDVGLMVDDGFESTPTVVKKKKKIHNNNHDKDQTSNDETQSTTLSTPTRNYAPRTPPLNRRRSENHWEETKEQEQEQEQDEQEDLTPKLFSLALSNDACLVIHARTNSSGDCFDDVSGLEELDDDDGEHADDMDSRAVDAGSDINKTDYHELLYPSISLPSQQMSTGQFQTSPPLSFLTTPKVDIDAPSPEQEEKEEDGGECAKSLSDSWEESMYFIVSAKESRNPPETMCLTMKSTSETGPLSLKNPWDETKEQN